MKQLVLWSVLIIVALVCGYLYLRARKPEESAGQEMLPPARYVDEKRAKAIKQAALFAGSDGKQGAPQCPRCGAEMALEMARRGKQAGARFWGCTEYPACRGTREA